MSADRCTACGHSFLDHHGPGGYCRAAVNGLECKCHHFAPLAELTGNCEDDCLVTCAYPGQFSECELGALA